MKKYFLSLIFTSFTLVSFSQADLWLPIDTTGFGNPQNEYIAEFENFNGKIYCATGWTGIGNAQIRYSSSGNSGSWTQVTSFTPPLAASVKVFPSFGKDSNGGIMWMGTGGPAGLPTSGTRIYRTTDGINFSAISNPGFNGNTGLITPSPNMIVFQGSGDTQPYLYAGAGSHGGNTNAEVWRIPRDSTNPSAWVRLIDFDTIPVPFPVIPATDTVDLISYWCVWKNKIYFSTNCKGQLWESTDGINFTQNMSVGYGFGEPTQIVIACLQVFNDTLYASTTNKILGGQMYRTGDGINWDTITVNAFGKDSTAEELHDMDTAFGYIWVTAYTDVATSNGVPIWRSSDGVTFIQSNIDGFGNPLINGKNPNMGSFANNMYFGGPNYADGSQIWRTDMTTGIKETQFDECRINLFPNPFHSDATLEFDSECSDVSKLSIYDMTGKLIFTVENLSEKKVEIEKENLNEGLYFYRVQTEKGTATSGKFIIQ